MPELGCDVQDEKALYIFKFTVTDASQATRIMTEQLIRTRLAALKNSSVRMIRYPHTGTAVRVAQTTPEICGVLKGM